MKAKQLRKIHITNDDVWLWTTNGNSQVILFNKRNNNQRENIFVDINPSAIKLTTFYQTTK